MVCSYLLHECVFKLYIEEPISSVQFENDNDVTPSVINMNRSRFPIF